MEDLMKRSILVTLFFLVASVAAYGQCSEADKKKLEEYDKAWGDAAVRGDRAALETYYADDFVNMMPTGVQTKAQVIDSQVKQAEKARASAEPQPKVTADNYVITCNGKTATITHRNVITTMTGGKEETRYSRSVHFLENRGGRWQAVSSTGYPLGDGAILLYMEQEWNDADMKHNAAWFERNYADDYTSVGSRKGELTNKAEDIQEVKTSKMTLELAELSELSARVEGNTAVVTGVNHVKGKDEKGNAFDRMVRFTDTYIKRDGRWLVWATQGTEIKK
jgi:ketosteroid isomerase-like protein